MKKLLLLFAIPVSLYSQNIGINTQNPDASAALEIQSTDAGILIPRMSEAQRNLIASPATGLLVYQTDGASGFYFFDGSAWTSLSGNTTSTNTGLEQVTEGGKTGYRLVGRDTANYGNIGSEAIDFSYSASPSTAVGAMGDYSIALGVEASASGRHSASIGNGATANDYSYALGYGADATGDDAYAIGEYAYATGDYSYVFGYDAEANSNNAHAFGYEAYAGNEEAYAFGTSAEASGEQSYAFGEDAEASGKDAYAFGDGASADSAYSYAFGYGAQTTGGDAYAFGDDAESSGSDAYAFGNNAVASAEDAYAFGEDAEASAKDAYAFGDMAQASGEYSYAFGNDAMASGFKSTAIGDSAMANGAGAYAIGYEVTASGNYSLAMGRQSTASGNASTAMGFYTNASGSSSTAMGFYTNASGVGSTAMGSFTNAPSVDEVVLGRYNSDYTPIGGISNWNSSDRLFVIGNGQFSALSDAMIVYKSGNTTINGALTLSDGANSITLPNTDGTAGQVLTTDGSGNVSFQNTPAFFNNMQGGTAAVGSSGGANFKEVTITFPTPFSTTPTIVGTVVYNHLGIGDMFIATLKGYNNAQCVFRIERIDNAYVNGAGSGNPLQSTSWGADLKLNWMAFE